MGVDMIGAMRAGRQTHDLDADELRAVLRRTRAGFHRAVAGMALAGNDVVVDHVLSEPWRLADLLVVLAEIDVVFVGVHCDPTELRRREATREDRPLGTADGQLELVHAHGVYDVEVNSGVESVETCSAQVRGYLRRHPAPTSRAFATLRSRGSV